MKALHFHLEFGEPLDNAPLVYDATAVQTWPMDQKQPLLDTKPDPDYAHPLPDHGTVDNPIADGKAHSGKPYVTVEPYGHTPEGDGLTFNGYVERFVNPDGSPHVPANMGAVPGTRYGYRNVAVAIRDNGAVSDRIGYEGGVFMSFKIDGEPATFDQRALSLDSLAKPYHEYELTGYLPDGWHIETGEVAYAYGRDGGSTQLVVVNARGEIVTIRKLLDAGVLVAL